MTDQESIVSIDEELVLENKQRDRAPLWEVPVTVNKYGDEGLYGRFLNSRLVEIVETLST